VRFKRVRAPSRSPEASFTSDLLSMAYLTLWTLGRWVTQPGHMRTLT